MWKFLLLLVLLSVWNQVVESKDLAFVTLLYGEDFLLGVRVLGQSIRESNTKADLVVIVTGQFSDRSLSTLRGDGWIVHAVEEISNPGKGPQEGTGFPPRFSAVYTKLTIFRLTQYRKVVYLDADTVMLRNSDELFNCPGFCATLRHSEHFNSGVMVVTPSEEVYNDMISKIGNTPSYTGGDQGFFNVYFEEFINAPLFNSDSIPQDTKLKMMKLGTEYNADIGLYILNSNKWMIPESHIKIVHYTLGPFKPWNWWTSWVIKDLEAWKRFRFNLPRDANGYEHGISSVQKSWINVMSWFPFLIIGLILYKYFGKLQSVILGGRKVEPVASTSAPPLPQSIASRIFLPKQFIGRSILIGYCTLLTPLGIVLYFLPNEIPTFWGWLLVYEWVLLLHGIFFALYLARCSNLGKKSGTSSLPSFKLIAWSKPWRSTLKSACLAVVMVLACPWIAELLFVKSFVGKVIVTTFGGLLLSIYLTHIYGTLSIRWFMFGRTEFTSKNGG